MPLEKDSLANTFLVATLLCLVCALVVSGAAVALKSTQVKNAQLDRKKNILTVSGFSEDDIKSAGIEQLFKDRFEATIIDLETGEEASEACNEAMAGAGKIFTNVVAEYDQLWASKSKKESICKGLDRKDDKCGIKYRERYSHVFMLKGADGKTVEKYVFPVRGNGLWSLMQGYLAVEPDFQTVAGLTFYEQAETAGLGGEVMNPNWKKKWPGKLIYDGEKVALAVSKGDQSQNPYGVDALAGATITSNGVTNMIEYWMGSNGFGKYIAKTKSGASGTTGGSQ